MTIAPIAATLVVAALSAYFYRRNIKATHQSEPATPVALALKRPSTAARPTEAGNEPEYERADPSKPRYKPRTLLTDNEAEFFARLETAVPEYRIFPQISMTAIIEPSSKDRYWTHFNRIAMQRVDYVVYTRDLRLICVIELDDRTHDKQQKRDERRDSRLSEAGVNTLRFDSRAKPRPEALRAAIRRLVHQDASLMQQRSSAPDQEA